ncbi:hypothetical protein [Anaerotaenia torta]|uniref:hypothetical protein n=1 Tax=Anaerotaenia torta TaxID=433293 RepID=UPI003D2514E9
MPYITHPYFLPSKIIDFSEASAGDPACPAVLSRLSAFFSDFITCRGHFPPKFLILKESPYKTMTGCKPPVIVL